MKPYHVKGITQLARARICCMMAVDEFIIINNGSPYGGSPGKGIPVIAGGLIGSRNKFCHSLFDTVVLTKRPDNPRLA